MIRFKSLVVSAVLVLGLTGAAMAAQGGEGNNTGCNGQGNPNSPCQGNGGAGGAGGAGGSGGAGGAGGTGVGIGVGVAKQQQGQAQGQKQQQGQQQGQGQGQSQSYEGYSGAEVNVEGTKFDRYAPSIAAPALTSGGIGICLGSFSVGLTGPMAGVAFGKTTQDEGCARARDSMILHNMGHKGASLRVLAGESIKDAMIAEGILPAPKQAAARVVPPAAPTTVAPSHIFSDQTAAVTSPALVQGN